MKVKNIFAYVLLASLPFGMVSCENIDTDGTEQDGPSFVGGVVSGEPEPGGTSLSAFFDQIIAQQGANVPRKKVYIVAHRANTIAGAQADCPENSIPAIKKAIDVGADMIELDVRTTKDGKFVLMHDPDISATTNGSGNVQDMNLADIQKLDMKRRGGSIYKENGQTIHVPTLEEAMLACKDKIYVNLDIKAVSSPLALLMILKDTGTMGQVMIYGGGAEYVDYAVRYLNSDVAIHPYISSAGDVAKWAKYSQAKLFQYGADLWNGNSDIARQVRAKGFLTYSNILDYDGNIRNGNYSALDKFIASETDFIQTDRCEDVHTYLKQKGLR